MSVEGPTPRVEPRLRSVLGDASGAIADLGVLVPLAAALILVNGLDAGAVFVGAGLLVIGAGAWFRVPFPVQPLKALTAVAVARELAPDVIHAAGLELAGFLLLLSIGHVADAIARVFVKPVVRALQLGVGLLLVITSTRLVLDPPEVFAGTPGSPWPVVLAALAFVGVALAAQRRHYAAALLLFGAGFAATVAATSPDLSTPAFHLPNIDLPNWSAFGSAFVLLVIPQLPLTFGNAVVAVNDLSHEYFGQAARRVSPSRVCLSAGIGNVGAALIGGMPMCHGAGGLTAHVRLGARSARMNLLLGSAFLALGLAFAAQVPALLGLMPVWVLAAFLAYAGLRHAWLVADLHGGPLLIAVGAGALGAWLGNLAITAALALVLEHARRRVRRLVQRDLTVRWRPMAEAGAREDPPDAATQGGSLATGPSPDDTSHRKRWRFVGSTPFLVLVALITAIVIKTFLVQAFYIPSGSMVPTLEVGDRVFVNKFVYALSDIGRGDVVVFANPDPVQVPQRGLIAGFLHWLGEGIGFAQPEDEDFIKRVVALPGETIEIKDNVVLIDGTPIDEPYLTPEARESTGEFPVTTVPPAMLFVMGDNRGNSSDSRYGLGFVPIDQVIGKAFVIVWPPSHVGGLG